MPRWLGDGELGQRLVRLYDVDLVGDQPEPLTKITDAEHRGWAAGCREYQPDRILAVTDGERVNLHPRTIASDRWADLEHVCTEDLVLVPGEVIGCSPP